MARRPAPSGRVYNPWYSNMLWSLLLLPSLHHQHLARERASRRYQREKGIYGRT